MSGTQTAPVPWGPPCPLSLRPSASGSCTLGPSDLCLAWDEASEAAAVVQTFQVSTRSHITLPSCCAHTPCRMVSKLLPLVQSVVLLVHKASWTAAVPHFKDTRD